MTAGVLAAVVSAFFATVLGLVGAPLFQGEREYRRYLALRASWQCKVLDPLPRRTRRRRMVALLTLSAVVACWVGALVLVAALV